MKRYLSIFLLFAATSACDEPQNVDDNCDSSACEETGDFRVTWNPLPDCAGASSAQVVLVSDSGEVHDYVFACQDFTGVTSAIPVGGYEVTVNLLDDQEQLVAQSGSKSVDLRGESATTSDGIFFEFSADRGSIRLSWSVDCEPTDYVEVVIDDEIALTTSCWFAIEYPWVDVPELTLGSHTLTARLLTENDDLLATSAAQNLELEYGNQRLDLLAEF